MLHQSTAAFMVIRQKNGTVVKQWQNRWNSQTIEGHEFMPFMINEINSAISSNSDTVTIQFPEIKAIVDLVEAAVSAAYIVQLSIKKYTTPTATTGGTVVAMTTGEVVQASMNTQMVQVVLGSSLDPVGAQVPPRRYTTTILGAPARR
jgi:hypothetical protein